MLKVDNSDGAAAADRQADAACARSATRRRCKEALDNLTRSAGDGNGNLLALAIDAARAKATVGEISDAMEKVFGRHRAEIRSITGVYKREVSTMSDKVEKLAHLIEAFEEAEGRRPRILVAKIGQDGHDRGQKVIASAFADIGFDVDIGPLFATADEAARQAVENDVHILGVSSLAAAHLTAVPELKAALKKHGRDDIMIIIGGVVPPQDYDALTKAGAEAIFPPGTVIADAAEELVRKLSARLGHPARRRNNTVLRRGITSYRRAPASGLARRTRAPPKPVVATKTKAVEISVASDDVDQGPARAFQPTSSAKASAGPT